MKWMFASDIHGAAEDCAAMLRAFTQEGCERLLLLGDILYHGARNDLPAGYAPKEVTNMLNAMRTRIYAVRGNCDAEVDQMVLQFPILSEYALIPVGARVIYATHGHHYGDQNPPPLNMGDVLLCGHTHIPLCAQRANYVYLNPGSVALPKQGNPKTYIIFDGHRFVWKTLDDAKEWLSWEME